MLVVFSLNFCLNVIRLITEQELKATSSREIEALRRELEEEAARQRLHFLEEAELLKCQSEEHLQKKSVELKVGCLLAIYKIDLMCPHFLSS